LPAPVPGLGRAAARAYAGDAAAAPGRRRGRLMQRVPRTRLQRFARVGSWLFLALVGWLLVRYARGVDWAAVAEALRGYGPAHLALALALSLLSYATYACYDLAARRYAGHALDTRRVLPIAATCYAFALGLGALIGGAGLRLRMYARAGLPVSCIVRVVAFSVATNWVGYVALAGVLFATGTVATPVAWGLGGGLLRGLGVAMLLLAIAYLAACVRWRGRTFHFRGHHFRLPSPGLALVQMALAAGNWSLMGTLVWVLLDGAVGLSRGRARGGGSGGGRGGGGGGCGGGGGGGGGGRWGGGGVGGGSWEREGWCLGGRVGCGAGGPPRGRGLGGGGGHGRG